MVNNDFHLTGLESPRKDRGEIEDEVSEVKRLPTHHTMGQDSTLNKEEELPEHEPSSLSASWLWKHCDQPP